MAPEFCDTYIRLGLDYRVPILMTASLAAYAPNDNLMGITETAFRPGVARAREAGFAIFDAALQTTWGRSREEPAEPAYRALVERIREGLSYFCLHFNAPGELEAIEPDSAHVRSQEYELFRSAGFREWLAGQGLEITGMRPLRDALRQRLAAPQGRSLHDGEGEPQ